MKGHSSSGLFLGNNCTFRVILNKLTDSEGLLKLIVSEKK